MKDGASAVYGSDAIAGVANFIMKRDTDPAILKEVEEAFVVAANSDGFRAMVESKFFQLDVQTGEQADRTAAKLEVITVDTFNKFSDQIGAEVKSAIDLGLPSPADFDSWWPPAGYSPK